MERDNLMHGARTALNTDSDIRAWAENFLKEKTRAEKPEMSDEEFEKYWKYHKPEIMRTCWTSVYTFHFKRIEFV